MMQCKIASADNSATHYAAVKFQFPEWTLLIVIIVLMIAGVLYFIKKRSPGDLDENEYRTFRKIIESSAYGVIIMDPSGRISFVNQKVIEDSGFSRDQIIGKNIKDIKGISAFSDEYEKIWQVLQTGSKWTGETRLRSRDEEEKWLRMTLMPVVDGKKHIRTVILTTEDITLMKLSAKEIEEAKKTKSKFTSMVSHELRTPLTVIKEIISIVLRGAAGKINDEQKDFLETARRNIERLSRLVNNVLDFQKLGSGKMPLYFKKNDINETITEIYKSMYLLAEEKDLRFDLELDDTIPLISFDHDKIIQVLTNIVNNSIKFTDNGGIKISSSKTNDEVTVSIEDTGIGIPSDEIRKLFRPFEQLGDPETRRSGGTGLGLVISKEIISKHGGRIWAESTYGKGTTFLFTLPINANSTI
jgi:PAS domain S-box-containing protein